MRRAARLRSLPPTVTPICASSPAAWTAVVTISVPRGGPPGRPSAGAGFGSGPGTTRLTGLTLAGFAFAAAGLSFAVAASGFAGFTGFALGAFAFAGFAAARFAAGFAGFVPAGLTFAVASCGVAGFVRAAFGFAFAAARSAFVACRFFARSAFVACGFFARSALVACGFAAASLATAVVARADARRVPPIRSGRVLRRLPSTPGWALAFVAFLLFFFADFWVTRSTARSEFPDFARLRGTVNAESGRRPL
jgi:hypothetical protein